ncbi:Por secretion system C-terminal sorting domain-containing protein [Reichenbachiella faecimaris]|uniref:Por secretion system C-terminal sorting domain-containing protein n=1 Tax=Reichenbachiella faecimaris TaxID=692418 RepID=A0A1W2GB19_REIFA|nr:T9SS type A sorting domain-containing protein [Reichenbachiella faecimaris]SMD33879.1 Por secretion system C-terminal sorting domain-containing protein [Reichenbachiella faecimaris]
MNTRSLLLSIAFFILSTALCAQQLERHIIAAAGSNSTTGSYTLGEVIVGSTSNGDLEIISGFQQPFPVVDSPLNVEDISKTISVYPVPAENRVTINGPTFDPELTDISLFSSQGQKIKISPIRSKNKALLDISHLPAGNYYLTLLNEANSTIAKYKILKLK